MRLIHLFANGFVVASHECVAHGQHAVFLAEHEMGAGVILLANFGANLLELFPRAVAQRLELAFGMLGGDVLHDVLTRVTTVVVGRAHEFVLHARVQQHELVAFGVEGEILELTRTAVQTHQLAGLSEDAGELVHDAALHAHVVVFRGLTGEHDVPLGNLVVAEKVVQTAGEAAFHGCRRRHSRSEGHVASESDVVAFHGHAELLHFERDTVDVASPRCTRTLSVVEIEIDAVFQVD